MTTTQKIERIFSTLHDGTISAWTGDKNLLTLTVDCQYLAERIDKSFDKFYLELFTINRLEFTPWSNSVNVPAIIKTDWADIFKAELEILSADIQDEIVIIACNQSNPKYNYSGGNLAMSCQTIKVFDQNKNELTVDQFDQIAKNYWNEWSKQ